MKNHVTLYLADDHQIVIDGLKLLIGSDETFKIVGWANDGETAYHEIADRKPNLALVDLSMPKMNGLELIFSLWKKLPDTRFIILSMYDNLRDIKAAESGGASGYILKNANRAELMKCLNTVLAGNTYFPDLKNKKLADQQEMLFTPRETEVIRLIFDNLSSAQIAEKLHLSLSTVDTHRKNINRKAGMSSAIGLKKFIEENQIEL